MLALYIQNEDGVEIIKGDYLLWLLIVFVLNEEWFCLSEAVDKVCRRLAQRVTHWKTVISFTGTMNLKHENINNILFL